MPEDRLARLQAAALDLALDPDPGDFGQDPEAWARLHRLAPPDGASLARYQAGWLLYRNLIRTTLGDPLEDALPLTKALLEAAGAWEDLLSAFLASRPVLASPYYRDIPASFVAWMAGSGWGQDRWPFLLQLAHFEVVELDVVRAPDEPPPPDLVPEPALDHVAVLDPAARNLAYGFAVQQATEAAPEPPPGCAWLLCHRDPEGAFHVLELTPHVSALLARSQEGQALGPALAALGADPGEAFALLRDLRQRGAILGFRPA